MSARNLLTIIDEILDFSKIEAGKIQLAERYFSVEDTVLSVVELLAPSAQEKGLQIAWTVDRASSGEFIGDAARVRQILLNLISNAVKFTDRGGVRVSVTAKEMSTTPSDMTLRLQIRVSDTGIGLSETDQRQLFSEFAQTDEALKRQSGGTGLGLAISKRLAEVMGGSLSVESNVGRGSCFIAELELKPVFGAVASHGFATLQESPKLKVLLAFDLLLERAALAEILSDAGIDVVECRLEEASDVAEQAARNHRPFTRIVVDAEADPELAARTLRNTVAQGTACGFSDGEVRGLVLVNVLSRDMLPTFQRVGFDAYLVRPVRPKTVFEQLIAYRGHQNRLENETPGCDHAEPRVIARETLNFLLVEDNDINALLVDRQLKRLGHKIERVDNGASALEMMEQVITGDCDRFDVILMDVLLPEMDGFEATARIAQLFSEHGIEDQRPPVIALTANAFEEDKKRCLDAGMDDYLAKPFDQQMLAVVLDRCFANQPK